MRASPQKNLEQWLQYLATLHPSSIDLGLTRIQRVFQQLNRPQPAPLVISVSGTNGKGSCVALLRSLLRAAGYRVGTYTSPHLLRYNERIEIDGCYAQDAAIVAAFERIEQARGATSLTYFETGTLAAMLLFAAAKLDVVVLEVGLGGRLDATNIIDADLAIVTSIDLDHQQWLGADREAIGREKAGIFRPQRPAVCGDPEPPNSVLAAAEQCGATLYCVNRDFSYQQTTPTRWCWRSADFDYADLPLPQLPGAIQQQNAAAVLMGLTALNQRVPITRAAIASGLTEVTLPGRCQRLAAQPEQNLPEIVLDVAHNAAAIQALLNTVQQWPQRPVHCVFALLDDKPVEQIVTLLAPLVTAWYLAPLATPRALPVAVLQQVIGKISDQRITTYDSVNQAFVQAQKTATAEQRLLVTGSFYTVAEVMPVLELNV